MLKQILLARVASDEGAVRLVPLARVAAFGGIPILAFHRVPGMELSEARLLSGVLSTISAVLMFSVLGLLMAARTRMP